MQALNMGLRVMDSTALSLCKDNSMPIIVFDLHQDGALETIMRGEKCGTLVTDVRDSE
jgi:uridylate kinase